MPPTRAFWSWNRRYLGNVGSSLPPFSWTRSADTILDHSCAFCVNRCTSLASRVPRNLQDARGGSDGHERGRSRWAINTGFRRPRMRCCRAAPNGESRFRKAPANVACACWSATYRLRHRGDLTATGQVIQLEGRSPPMDAHVRFSTYSRTAGCSMRSITSLHYKVAWILQQAGMRKVAGRHHLRVMQPLPDGAGMSADVASGAAKRANSGGADRSAPEPW